MADPKLDQLCIDTVRMLSLDQVQAANSGHPGMPLSASTAVYTIFDRFLRFNPNDPDWCDRDRFVLSAGHGCAMLYAMLHLTGYDISLDQLKNFRQLGSITPGHPEAGHTPGVEATTGPLGQGISNAVGMALAEAHLAETFNRPGHEIINHRTFVICSDGDLMEGVSSEACSLAGFLQLGKLIVIYDDNDISIEGETRKLAYDEDTESRFKAYGWQVIQAPDGNDIAALRNAIAEGLAETRKPTIIRMRTRIGYNSPREGTAKAHGEPFDEKDALLTRKACNWPEEPFHIPQDALQHLRRAVEKGANLQADWNRRFQAYESAHPELAEKLRAMLNRELPQGWENDIPTFQPGADIATRNAGGEVMNAIAQKFDGYLVGGSADLAPSTKTIMKQLGHVGPGRYAGSNIHFGVREHAMGAILNGIAYHRGLIPFGATFFVFSDYCRPSIRLAALSKLPVIYVFTHDSIGVGEDGPTHQPVEHLAALRAIPNLVLLRPADANETAQAWKIALQRADGPTALALTRQKLPILDPRKYPIADGVPKGGYILSEAPDGKPRLILIATGSEVALALEAQQKLAADGVNARVVSMPSWELFNSQPQDYKDRVLPPEITARLAVEAGVRTGWDRYIGTKGDIICMTTFGASGPYKKVLAHFGFTAENIISKATALL